MSEQLLSRPQDYSYGVPGRTAHQSWKSVVWASMPYAAMVGLLPALVVVFTPARHYPGAFLAWVNWLIGGTALLALIRRRSVATVPATAYMLLFLIAWPFGALYIAIRSPEGTYNVFFRTYDSMAAMPRIQLAVMTFLIPYLAMLFLFLPSRDNTRPIVFPPGFTQRFAKATAVVGVGLTLLHAFHQLAHFPGPAAYLINGAFKYLIGIYFVVGVLWSCYSKSWKIGIFIALIPAIAIYTVFNARGYAMRVAGFSFLGVMLLREISQRRKVIFMAATVSAAAFFMAFAETTRAVLGTKTGHSFGERLEALSRWREVIAENSPLDAIVGRLYLGSGAHVIKLTPDAYPFKEFAFFDYVKEFFLFLLVPGVVQRWLGLGAEHGYAGYMFLAKYGYRVDEGVGVSPSTVGAQWVLGGFLPVLFGGLFMGVLHGLFGRWLNYKVGYQPLIALFIASISLAVTLKGPNDTLMMNTRNLLVFTVASLIFYYVVIRPFVNRQSRGLA